MSTTGGGNMSNGDGPPTFRHLSASGRSAVAVWEVTGPPDRLDRLLSEITGSRREASSREGRLRLVRIGPPPAEDAVCVRVAAGTVEIQTHGGLAVDRRMRTLLRDAGCADRETRTFAEECVDAFGRATTRRTAGLLAGVCFGRLESDVSRLKVADRGEAAAGLRRLLEHTPFGLSLTQARRVALFGPPNAGKSSLMNRLVGYDRSITDPRPGATRDLVTATTAIDGWPVELVDTAGLREADDTVERDGVSRAVAAKDAADLRVLVLDRSAVVPAGDAALLSNADVVVAHKSDREDRSGVSWPADALPVSSLTGEGVAELIERLGRLFSAAVPPEDAPFFVTRRQFAAAERVLASGGTAATWEALLSPHDGGGSTGLADE